MKKIFLNVDGKELQVVAQKINGKIWFHTDGETFEYNPSAKQAQSGGGAATQDPSQISAPMPGKIIKVFCKPGDLVEEGQTLVAMEAMKMEYNLKAAQAMKVIQVNCQEGQQVSLAEILVKMEECDG